MSREGEREEVCKGEEFLISGILFYLFHSFPPANVGSIPHKLETVFKVIKGITKVIIVTINNMTYLCM